MSETNENGAENGNGESIGFSSKASPTNLISQASDGGSLVSKSFAFFQLYLPLFPGLRAELLFSCLSDCTTWL